MSIDKCLVHDINADGSESFRRINPWNDPQGRPENPAEQAEYERLYALGNYVEVSTGVDKRYMFASPEAARKFYDEEREWFLKAGSDPEVQFDSIRLYQQGVSMAYATAADN